MNETFEPGDYYVGDLCYVLRDEWDEVCNLLDAGDGVFKLSTGTKIASYGTAYGDGVYVDQKGHKYPVDAGLIGCVAVKDLDANILKNNIHLGNIIKFDKPFTTSEDQGVIVIGNLSIDTN
jgi:hypothetical protein